MLAFFLHQKRIIRASNSQHKWLQDCARLDVENAFSCELAYIMAPKCTKSIELKFKHLHRLKSTDNFLFRAVKKEIKNYTFCNGCPETSSFWEGVVDWLRDNLPITGEYTFDYRHCTWSTAGPPSQFCTFIKSLIATSAVPCYYGKLNLRKSNQIRSSKITT